MEECKCENKNTDYPLLNCCVPDNPMQEVLDNILEGYKEGIKRAIGKKTDKEEILKIIRQCQNKEGDITWNDCSLAKAIDEYIEKQPCEPNLGCATTKELLDEIRARIEINGQMEYRTVDN